MAVRHHTLTRFGRNVRRQREAIGLSQEALAEKADLDRTYVSGIERGVRNPTILSAARVATALKTSLAQLLNGVAKLIKPEICSRGDTRRMLNQALSVFLATELPFLRMEQSFAPASSEERNA